MKFSAKRIVSAAAAGAVVLSSLALAACKTGEKAAKTDKNGLTDTQREKVLALSEAFFESGKGLNENEPLSMTGAEKFVYYLYNDELEAGEDGYATVSLEDAKARLDEALGFGAMARAERGNGERPDFYYENGSYYVRVNEPAADSVEIKSVEKNDDGNYSIEVEASKKDGDEAVLSFVFELDGDNVRVLSCTRCDER